jgi:hypothetical protein
MNKEEQALHHQKWREVIKEQETSGLKQGAFCKERNISSAQLSYYRGIFKSQPTPIGTFAPVTIKQPLVSKDIRLTLPNGFQCVFPSDLNALQIREWITVLLSC